MIRLKVGKRSSWSLRGRAGPSSAKVRIHFLNLEFCEPKDQVDIEHGQLAAEDQRELVVVDVEVFCLLVPCADFPPVQLFILLGGLLNVFCHLVVEHAKLGVVVENLVALWVNGGFLDVIAQIDHVPGLLVAFELVDGDAGFSAEHSLHVIVEIPVVAELVQLLASKRDDAVQVSLDLGVRDFAQVIEHTEQVAVAHVAVVVLVEADEHQKIDLSPLGVHKLLQHIKELLEAHAVRHLQIVRDFPCNEFPVESLQVLQEVTSSQDRSVILPLGRCASDLREHLLEVLAQGSYDWSLEAGLHGLVLSLPQLVRGAAVADLGD